MRNDDYTYWSEEIYKRRKAKRLLNLRIDSVDSVDRGAGEGVNVVLMKRANTEELNMREPSLSAIITKVEKMRADGQITQMTEGALHQHIALEMFPESLERRNCARQVLRHGARPGDDDQCRP